MKTLSLLKKRFIKEVAVASLFLVSGTAMAFDLDTGYAPTELIIPNAFELLSVDVSKSGSDATLVLRHTAMISNAWFDAVAPYHPTQVGVFSKITQRRTETGNREKNISVIYAAYRVLSSLAPHRQAQWDGMLLNLGLDPTDDNMNQDNPIGIGNIAGMGVVKNRIQDGMNQLGDAGGVKYNRKPYRDYTGYKPVNTFQKLKDAGRWQPAEGTNGFGKFTVQQFATPQMGITKAYSFKKADSFNIPAPWKSNPNNYNAYKAQVDEVLNISANLTDEQKLIAELFDYKLRSLGFSEIFAAKKFQLPYIKAVQMAFLSNMSEFDTAIAVWHQKIKYDAVRPWSAISYVYGDRKVTAWGGPGKGTVNDIPGKQWTSYLPVADHAEYPSGSAAFCAAHSLVLSRFLNTDELGWTVDYKAGSSTYEPGFTPRQNTQLQFTTWSDLREKCGLSRLYAGVHFRDSIDAGYSIGDRVGEKAYNFLQKHINGNVASLSE
jgi:hypothetical protein